MTNKKLPSYWKVYGGFKALFSSLYFYAAIAITLLSYNLWLNDKWWEDSISLLPNLLGFSLGGYAMFVSVGSDDFRKMISGSSGHQQSRFMKINAMFVHFIVLQIFALVYALLAKAFSSNDLLKNWVINNVQQYIFITLEAFFSFVGYLLLIYSLISALAAGMGIFRFSGLYDLTIGNSSNNRQNFPQWTKEFKDKTAVEGFSGKLSHFFERFEKGIITEDDSSFGLEHGLLENDNGVSLNVKGKLFKALLDKL